MGHDCFRTFFICLRPHVDNFDDTKVPVAECTDVKSLQLQASYYAIVHLESEDDLRDVE